MTPKDKELLTSPLEGAESESKELKRSNMRMQAELIEIKDINAGQSNFLDALENTLLDHGYELVKREVARND